MYLLMYYSPSHFSPSMSRSNYLKIWGKFEFIDFLAFDIHRMEKRHRRWVRCGHSQNKYIYSLSFLPTLLLRNSSNTESEYSFKLKKQKKKRRKRIFLFLVLTYSIKSLRINLFPYQCFPFLLSKYWFPLPHFWYSSPNDQSPLVYFLLCVLQTDKSACLWLAAARQPTGGAHRIFGRREKIWFKTI